MMHVELRRCFHKKIVKIMHKDEEIRHIDANFAQRDGIKIWHQFFSLGRKLKPFFDAIPLR